MLGLRETPGPPPELGGRQQQQEQPRQLPRARRQLPRARVRPGVRQPREKLGVQRGPEPGHAEHGGGRHTGGRGRRRRRE